MKVVTREIGTGEEAIARTIDHMRRLARRDARTPDVRVVAERIQKQARQWSEDAKRYELELVRGAFDWVVDNITYQYDHEHVTEHADPVDPENTEFLIAPRHLTTINKGDCDDMSMMLASLLLALGFRKVAYKTIAHRSREYSHDYVEVALPESDITIPLDPVLGKDGFAHEKGSIIRKQLWNV